MALPNFNSWSSQISQFSSDLIQASSIPAVIHDDIMKSKMDFGVPQRGFKSLMADPLAVQYALGYKDRKYSLTYDVLKRIPHQLGVVAAILQTRCNQVAAFSVPYRESKSVGFQVKHKDPEHSTSKSELEFIRDLERFVYNCGAPDPNPHNKLKRDDFETFLKKIVRDSLMYDQSVFEVVPDRLGQPYEFLAVDAATIRIAAANEVFGPNDTYQQRSPILSDSLMNERTPFKSMQLMASQKNGERPDFIQLINGQIENVYFRNELAFGVRNPRTDIYVQGYGYGELEQLITIITAHLHAEEYNRRFFTQGSAPKGLLNFKGENFTPDMLEGFKRQWRANLEGVENSWKTPILQAEQGVEWIDLHPSNREMEYGQWVEYLIKITCFTGDTPVVMGDGTYKAIDSLEPGENVRTHTGNLQPVENIQKKHYEGPLHHIRAGEVIKTTPNHPFYVVKSTYNTTTRSREFDEPGWKTADEIVEGVDYLLVPKKTYQVQGTTTEIDLSSYVSNFKEDGDKIAPKANRVSWVPRSLPLTEDVAFMLGLYASEGNATDSAIHFTFSSEEEDLQNHVCDTFKRLEVYAAPYKSKDTTRCVRVTSSLLAKAFSSLFGSKAINKKVPAELMSAPRDVQRAFISGVIAGDGSVPNFAQGAVTATLSSVSKDLLEQTRHLLLCQDVYARKYSDIKNTGFASDNLIHRLDVNGTQAVKLASWLRGTKGDSLRARVSQATQIKSQVYESSSYFMVPVTEHWTTEYSGDVYNIEVAEEHTYQVNRFAVHNCAVFLMDPAELNFDLSGSAQQTSLFESSQEWKLKASRDRGLKPMLRFISKQINEHIIGPIDDHFVFDFVGLDELTEQEKHELRQEQVASYMTLNEIRRAEDLPDVEDGDTILNPTYIQARQMRIQAQQEADAAEQQEQVDGASGEAAPPPPAGADTQGQQANTAPEYAGTFRKSQGESKIITIDLDTYKDLSKG